MLYVRLDHCLKVCCSTEGDAFPILFEKIESQGVKVFHMFKILPLHECDYDFTCFENRSLYKIEIETFSPCCLF